MRLLSHQPRGLLPSEIAPVANFWNHSELEPFCIYDRRRDDDLQSHSSSERLSIEEAL
jgi:hypothetical protein